MTIVSMGKFTAVGMRAVVPAGSVVINTCHGNDTVMPGTLTQWAWANPTNRAFPCVYHDLVAVSVECLWQGTKVFYAGGRPSQSVLRGEVLAGKPTWKLAKGKRPIGAYAGPSAELITSPGQARREIYVPAYRAQVVGWLAREPEICGWIERLRAQDAPVFLRDYDVGRGLDRNGPMSHAWVLAVWLNTGLWPE